MFLTEAVEQKSPAGGALIQEVFKQMLGSSEEDLAKKTICRELSVQMKAMLFLASDEKQSKILNVVRDLVNAGVKIVDNSFLRSITKMLSADAVNVLRNV